MIVRTGAPVLPPVRSTAGAVEIHIDSQAELQRSPTNDTLVINGMTFKRVSACGDGNGKFRALGVVCDHFIEVDHIDLRQMTYDWCRDHQGDLNLSEQEVQSISSLGSYGNDVTLCALADCLKITIKVAADHGDGSPIIIPDQYTFHPHSGASSQVVNLYWKLRESHYDALIISESEPTRIASSWSTGNSQVECELHQALSQPTYKKRQLPPQEKQQA